MASSKIRFGIIQYPLTADFGANLRAAFSALERARRGRPDYVALPEMWLGGPQSPAERPLWLERYHHALKALRDWCRLRSVGCFFSQLERERGDYFNTAYLITPKGAVSHSYRKIHLFSLGGETRIYSPGGHDIRIWKTPFGKVGCVICYDIRFPELIRALAVQGAKALVVCAQWPASRLEHWLTLLRARAIENQMFVIASNRLGKKGAIAFNGHSVIFDPWGNEILRLGPKASSGAVPLDFSEVDRIRREYPFLREKILK